MEEPVKPNLEDCCNSGCNPCIFDIYENQLKLYKKYLLTGTCVNSTSQDNGISQIMYTEFTVVKNVTVCSLHNLIVFRRLKEDKTVWWNPGDHFLMKYTKKEHTCTRAYTPLKIQNEQIGLVYGFSIIVKKYDNGLVSTHLCNIKEGDTTLWRGPYGHYKLEPNKFHRIVMIAQGTGIAPFITIIDNILNNEDDMTKIMLLYCCKSDNILFREELYTLKSYWNFTYEIFIDGTSLVNFRCKYQEPIKNHKLSIEYLNNLKPFLASDQFLLCGSSKFNEIYHVYLKANVPGIENIIIF